MRALVLTMRLLLLLARSLRRLLPLILRWRSALLRRRLRCGAPLNVFAPLLRRSACSRCGALLEGRRATGTP